MRSNLLALVCFAVACNSTPAPAGNDLSGGNGDMADMAQPPGTGDMTMSGLLASRPYTANLHVPPSYNASTPAPLVMLLHGYTASGSEQELYFNLTPVSDAHGFIYVYPDGTKDSVGNRFWNATDACCDLFATGIDDDAYLTAVIDDIKSKFNIDDKRVFLVGHSNGAFMSHRMACTHADTYAGIVALAGDTFKDQSKCPAGAPMAVLQVQGDADATVAYAGGGPLYPNGGMYPGSVETIGDWAAKDTCTGTLVLTGDTLDLDTVLVGAETAISKFSCTAGAAELWTIHGGGHLPTFQTNPANMPTWGEQIYGWLAAHPKP